MNLSFALSLVCPRYWDMCVCVCEGGSKMRLQEQQHQPVTKTKYGMVAPTLNPNQTELLGMEQHLPVTQNKPNNFIQHFNLYLGSGSRGRDTSWSSMWRNEATWCAGLNYVSLPELNVPGTRCPFIPS